MAISALRKNVWEKFPGHFSLNASKSGVSIQRPESAQRDNQIIQRDKEGRNGLACGLTAEVEVLYTHSIILYRKRYFRFLQNVSYRPRKNVSSHEICICNRNMFAVAPKRLIISKNKDGALCRNAQGTTI